MTSPNTGVIITGAASGIGLASARALAVVDRPVALWDVDAERVQRCAQEIASTGAAAFAVAVDLADPAAIAAAAAETRARLSSVGGFVHAAGFAGPQSIADLSLETWERLHNVHLRALAILAQTFLPDMRRQPGGAIVAVSSITARLGHRLTPAYAAAKGGMVSLIQSLADEGAPDGIRANSVSPGFIRTPMVESVVAQLSPEWLEQRILMGRVGEAEEVASAVRFLMSDEASFITAHNLVVDGGQSHSER